MGEVGLLLLLEFEHHWPGDATSFPLVCYFSKLCCMCVLRVFLLVGRGGIQDGDIIVKVNGRPLVDSSELQEAVLNESPLLLEVRRGNDDLLFSIAPEVVM